MSIPYMVAFVIVQTIMAGLVLVFFMRVSNHMVNWWLKENTRVKVYCVRRKPDKELVITAKFFYGYYKYYVVVDDGGVREVELKEYKKILKGGKRCR